MKGQIQLLILILVSLLLLIGCNPAPIQESVEPTSTLLAVEVSNPTNTAAPTLTPTPVPELISSNSISRLSISSSFGFGETLRDLEFSPDGSLIVSSGGNSDDFEIRLWEVSTGDLQQAFYANNSIVWDTAFSPDGNYLAAAINDGSVNIWDMNNDQLVKTIFFPGQPTSVSFSIDSQTLAIGGTTVWPDAAIWTYSVPNWEAQLMLPEFWNISAIAFSSDGQSIVGGGTSRNVRTWRANNGQEQNILNHSGQVSSIAISPDNSRIATGLCESSDPNLVCLTGAIWLWDLQTGQLISQLSDFPDWVENVEYSPDGSMIYAGSRNGLFMIYLASELTTLFTSSSPGGGGILAISPDGTRLATAGWDGQIHIWSISP
jgi:WD40 repeat protein